MSTPNIGDLLYQMGSLAKAALFDQGELAQLTYGAFDVVANNVSSSTSDVIEISFPVGYRADRTSILSTRKYGKDQLLGRYQHLAFQQLPINGIVQLVTIIEAFLSDVVRVVVTRYPQKLGSKRTVPLQSVLEAKTLEEIHLRATDALLYDLSYKSPSEFAEQVQSLLSLNLLECPAFHRYVEVKATRDIYIHNRGAANDVYVRKAGSHARVQAGNVLPIDIPYFLESYECCLLLAEWLESELHERWHSSELEQTRSQQRPPVPVSEPATSLAQAVASEPAAVAAQPAKPKRARKSRRSKPVES